MDTLIVLLSDLFLTMMMHDDLLESNEHLIWDKICFDYRRPLIHTNAKIFNISSKYLLYAYIYL